MFSNLVYIDTPKVAERDRFSPYPMIIVNKALSLVLASVQSTKKRHLVNLHAGKCSKYKGVFRTQSNI